MWNRESMNPTNTGDLIADGMIGGAAIFMAGNTVRQGINIAQVEKKKQAQAVEVQ